MPEITDSGAILIETLARLIKNHTHANLDVDILSEKLGDRPHIARRIAVLGGMRPISHVALDVWVRGHPNSPDAVELTEHGAVDLIIADWMPEWAEVRDA